MNKWILGAFFFLAACAAPTITPTLESFFPVMALSAVDVTRAPDRAEATTLFDKRHMASGVLIEGGHVLTAAHVVQGEDTDVAVRLFGDAVFMAEVVYFNPEADLAVLKIKNLADSSLPVASLSCRDPVWSERVVMVGNPDRIEGALSVGYVSSLKLDRPQWARLVAFTGAGTFGSSGSPVFDTSGGVLGILVSGQVTNGSQTGLLFMVPVVDACDAIKAAL